MIIPPQFESAQWFSEGLAAVKKGEVFGYINQKGEWIIKLQFKFAAPFSEGMATVGNSTSEFGYIDSTGKIIVVPQYELAGSFSNGLAVLYMFRDRKMCYIDKKGTIIKCGGWAPELFRG
jgi:hypothetical protein